MIGATCKIEVTAPVQAIEPVLQALGAAGAGVLGEYSHCAFVTYGQGRFQASAASNPAAGSAGAMNSIEEGCIHTWCRREDARAVVAAIRAAHPYEEPVIYVIPLLDEAAL